MRGGGDKNRGRERGGKKKKEEREKERQTMKEGRKEEEVRLESIFQSIRPIRMDLGIL